VNTNAELHPLVARVAGALLQRRRLLVSAESCTGGWIGKAVTDLAGSSGWYLGGVVVYSNALKQTLLGVRPETLAAHGAVSEATAAEMASGALLRLGADVAVAVTGVAGPGGGQLDKPVGTVWFGCAWREGERLETEVAVARFHGDREAVRRQAVVYSLEQALGVIVRTWP
jgi:nicotinamide-nucleotide amidase